MLRATGPTTPTIPLLDLIPTGLMHTLFLLLDPQHAASLAATCRAIRACLFHDVTTLADWLVNHMQGQALRAAVRGDSAALVAAVLRHGHAPDVNAALDGEGRRALHLASELGKAGAAQALLSSPGINVDVSPAGLPPGHTPLVLAAKHGHAPVVSLLQLTRGVNVNGPGPGMPPLVWAAQMNHMGVVEVLLQAPGLSTCAVGQGSSRKTALHWAAHHNNTAMLRLLLNMPGASPNATDANSVTPLMVAAEKGSVDALQVLLECQQIDVTMRSTDGCCVLHFAASHAGGGEMVRVLLARQPGLVNVVDNGGATPLQCNVQS